MRQLPGAGLFTQVGPRPTVDAYTQGNEDVAQWAREQIQAPDPLTPDTISGGTLTLSQSSAVIEGEGAAADDLQTISVSGVPDGTVVLLRIFDVSHPITLKHQTSGSGHMELAGEADFVLDNSKAWAVLKLRGAAWFEITRSYGSNKSAFRVFWGLAIGSAVQAYSALLAAFAGLSAAADKIAYFTGPTSMAVTDFSSYARTLLALNSKAAVQSELGIGAAAVQFSANKGAGSGTTQTGIVPSTATKVTFPNEEYDIGGYYDAANSKFTPGVAGKYLITAGCQSGTNCVDQSNYILMIYKNGARIKEMPRRSSGTSTPPGMDITHIVDANGTTDYFEIYVNITGAGNKDILGNEPYTWFQAVRVG